MYGLRQVSFALSTVGILISGAAQAALHDRGGGLLYDDVLNVTWMQDASYAKTSGYDADGRMIWSAADNWAANLVYGGYDDWRLARNTPVGTNWTDWNENALYNGTTDWGYNITSPHSELSYMYYVNLGLKGYYSPTGSYQADFGVFGNGTTWGQKDVGPVLNLQSGVYWSGAENSWAAHWAFSTAVGNQGIAGNDIELYAWAVRPGDVPSVAAIPEPETYAMLLAGLGLLGVVARRRTRSCKQA